MIRTSPSDGAARRAAPPRHRRQPGGVLALLVAAALTAPAPAAAGPVDRAERVEAGRHWRLQTRRGPLHVWVPDGYDRRRAGLVVYVHGYGTDADRAWRRDRLARQFRASGRDAMFLVPGAPGDHHEPVRWPSVRAMVAVVRAAGLRLPAGPTVLIGHSGAYRSLLEWLDDRGVACAILLDAFYAGDDAFRAFVERGRRLIFVARGTRQRARRFVRGLAGAIRRVGVPGSIAELTPKERRARVLLLESQYRHAETVESGRVVPVVLKLAPLPRLRPRPAR